MADAGGHAWTENRPSTGRWLSQPDLREVWERRELVYFLALRDFKLRYAQAVFGVVWVLIQPLAAALLFFAIFGQVLGAPSDGIPYFLFAFAGAAVWTYTSQAVESASESLAAHAPVVTKVYFPRLVAPLASMLPGLVDLGIALLLLVGLLPFYDVTPSLAVLTLPLWIAAAVLVALGVGTWLSALNAKYRDVRYGLAFLLQVWFLASPIAYASSVADGAWEYAYAANPLVGVMDGLRWSVLDGPALGLEHLVSLGVGVALLVTGLMHFRATERRLADVI